MENTIYQFSLSLVAAGAAIRVQPEYRGAPGLKASLCCKADLALSECAVAAA